MKPADKKSTFQTQANDNSSAKEEGIASGSGLTSEEERKKKASESTPDEAAKGEKQAGGGGLLGALKDLATAVVKMATAIVRGITRGIKYLTGDEEEKEEGPEKNKTSFVDFLKNLFGFGKEKEKESDNTVATSDGSKSSVQQSDQQFSPEMMSQIEGVMKGVQDFMRGRSQQNEKNPANKGKAGVEVDEVAESPAKPKSTGPEGLEGNEGEEEKNPLVSALQKMVDAVAGTKDPELMKHCQGVLDEVSKENPSLQEATKGMSDKISTVQGEVEKESRIGQIEGMDDVLSTLKSSDSMNKGGGDRSSSASASDLKTVSKPNQI